MVRKLVSPVKLAAPGALFTPTIMTMFARKISRTYPAFFLLGRHQKDPKFGLINSGFNLQLHQSRSQWEAAPIPHAPARLCPQINYHPQNQMTGFYRKMYGFFYTVYTLRWIYIQMTLTWYFHFAFLLNWDQLLILRKNIHLMIRCKNIRWFWGKIPALWKQIRRVYGGIIGNQLQVLVPLILREPVKISRMAGQDRAR